MLLAVILDREMWGSRFYQTAFYLPVVLSLALVGFIWQLFYSTDQGLINQVFGTNVDWYGDPDVNLWAVLVATAWRHTGYIMLIYLAGLKGVDSTLREAAAVDGANEVKTFFQVIFPVMRPINLIVLVIVVIESLRAFDLVWVINKGRNGLELISALVSQNVIGEATRYGFGAALVGDHDGDLLGLHHHLPADRLPGGAAMSATTRSGPRPHQEGRGARSGRWRPQPAPRQGRHGRHAGPGADLALPAAVVPYNSFRNYSYTQTNGYLSFGGWTLDNYKNAWSRGQFGLHLKNSLLITIPAVIITLFLSSLIAFVLARFSYRFNLTLLGVFLAANLLPPQALLIPVFRMFKEIPLPTFMSEGGTMLNSFWALILVNTAFQMGFCAFVLSNYMKTLPYEIYESAEMDGASVWRQYWQLTMPLVRPALAALATLQVTWIYNEFFWATVLMSKGDKYPVTSALNNLRGQFFQDTNLVAAGSIIVALPVLIVFFVLQKQFVSGLTLGSTKG